MEGSSIKNKGQDKIIKGYSGGGILHVANVGYFVIIAFGPSQNLKQLLDAYLCLQEKIFECQDACR